MIEFDRVIVIGLGKLAYQCADYVLQNYGIESVLCDVNDNSSEFLRQMCDNSDVEYCNYPPDQLFAFLEAEQKRTLMISATNPLIIPKRVLEKANIKAINLHHALLPEHPGRYAEAWAIFENEIGGGAGRNYMAYANPQCG